MKITEKLNKEDFIKNTKNYEDIEGLYVKTYGKEYLRPARLISYGENRDMWQIECSEDFFDPDEIEEVYVIYEQTEKRNFHRVIEDDEENILQLVDGTKIHFLHYQECCEEVYADLTALEDTGFFEDTSITRNNIHIEFVKGYGIRLNGYGIPCYNTQNGYYSGDINILVETPYGKIEQELCFDCYENDIFDYC